MAQIHLPFMDYTEYLEELEQLLLRYLRCACRRLVAPEAEISSGLFLRGTAISKQEIAHFFHEKSQEEFFLSGDEPSLFALAKQTDVFFERATGDTQFPLEEIRKTFHLDFLGFLLLTLSYFVGRNQKYERLYAFLQDHIGSTQPTLGLGVLLHELYQPVTGAQVLELLQNTRISYLLLDQIDAKNSLHTTVQIPAGVFYYLEQAVYHPDETIMALYPPRQDFPEGVNLPLLSQLTQSATQAFVLAEPVVFHLSGPRGIGKAYSVQYLANTLGRSCCEVQVDSLLQQGAEARRDYERNILSTVILHHAILHLKIDGTDADLLAISQLVQRFSKELPVLFVSSVDENMINSWGFVVKKVLFEMPRGNLRLRYWEVLSAGYALQSELSALASKFILTPKQIISALKDARISCGASETEISDLLLTQAIQRNCTHKLKQRATLIRQAYTWEDLQIEPKSKGILRQVVNRVKYSQQVFHQYGFDSKISYGRGTSILLYGPPGTGKTMGAQVLAREIGLELYRIDLSQTVSKYIGETEKNLGVIFDEAKYINVILFFDEADALFSKRTEVKDSKDRYANIETSYLLQKIEEHEGVCILATNRVANFDDAFKRRINYMVEFPIPNYEMRLALWKNTLPAQMPVEGIIDFEFLAKNFEYSGSLIKNILLSAAYIAVGRSKGISMAEILEAVRLESAKIGKILWANDFPQYAHLISEDI